MTITKLQKLIAQGGFNYYSKHIEVVCESEFFGITPPSYPYRGMTEKRIVKPKDNKQIETLDEYGILSLKVSVSLYVNKTLIKMEKIQHDDWNHLSNTVKLIVERLKNKAYLELAA